MAKRRRVAKVGGVSSQEEKNEAESSGLRRSGLRRSPRHRVSSAEEKNKKGVPSEDDVIVSKLRDFTKSHSAQSSPLYAQAQRDLSPVTPGCCMMPTFISKLGQKRGMMAGMISFTIGCRCHDRVLEEVTIGPCHGPGPWSIPSVRGIREIKKKYDSLFILVVESYSLFSWMSVTHYETRFPCAIVYPEKDSKGHPDMMSRQFLKKLYAELKLPVLALVSCSPEGLNLLSIYRWGLQDDPMDLTIPDLIWLGLKPTHLNTHGFPDITISFSDKDMRIANNLLLQFHKDKEWEDELHCMIRMGVTADIANMLDDYPTDCYIPIELENIASSLPE